jgi:hypothetical protein
VVSVGAREIEATPDEPGGDVTSMSVRAVRTAARRRRRAWLAPVLLVVVGALVAVGAKVVRMQPATGELLITVAAPNGSRSIEVYVDGRVSCDAAPCTVDGLKPGTHLVHIVRAGSKPTAQLAATVAAGTQSTLHVEITDSDAPLAKAESPASEVARTSADVDRATAPAKDEEQTTVQSADTPTLHRVAAAVPRLAAPRAPIPPLSTPPQSPTPPRATPGADSAAATDPAAQAAAAAPPTANAPGDRAILRISSEPSVAVTVDGHPVGKTPRMVRVPPGTHRVAFFGSEGRTSQTVTVIAGATQDVTP